MKSIAITLAGLCKWITGCDWTRLGWGWRKICGYGWDLGKLFKWQGWG